jgi:hypothetical protein
VGMELVLFSKTDEGLLVEILVIILLELGEYIGVGVKGEITEIT